jgi:hypothetical protein
MMINERIRSFFRELPVYLRHVTLNTKHFLLLLIFSLMAPALPAAQETGEFDEYLLMKPIQDAFNTGDFNKLKEHSLHRISINFEPPFELNGYFYIDAFIEDFSREFAQFETNTIDWSSRYQEERFAVQSLNLVLKNKRSERTINYKLIFFLTKVDQEWKIYYLRGLKI